MYDDDDDASGDGGADGGDCDDYCCGGRGRGRRRRPLRGRPRGSFSAWSCVELLGMDLCSVWWSVWLWVMCVLRRLWFVVRPQPHRPTVDTADNLSIR